MIELIEENIINALSNREEFQRVIQFSYQLIRASQAFPHHAEALFAIVRDDPTEFTRVINTFDNLLGIGANLGSQYGETLFTIVLNNNEEFDRLIRDDHTLMSAMTAFPHHADMLMTRILNDTKKFHQVIDTGNHLRRVMDSFPQYAQTLLKQALQHPETFDRFVQAKHDLNTIKYIAQKFPEHADTLMTHLHNAKKFKELDAAPTPAAYPYNYSLFSGIDRKWLPGSPGSLETVREYIKPVRK